MSPKVPPADSAQLCAVALALCLAWFEHNRPGASILAEAPEGQWHAIQLLPAIQAALDAYRAEHGVEGL